MTKNLIAWINRILLIAIAVCIVLTVWYWITRPAKIAVPVVSGKKMSLPKGAFTRDEADYDAIGYPFLSLQFSPMSLQLPDLHSYIVYYGRNERPDANEGESMLHFSISGSRDIVSIPPGEPLYLVYDQNQPRIRYVFSPNNNETSLWIEATPLDKEVSVRVSMRNEAGRIIRQPEKFAQFNLPERQFTRIGGRQWEIGRFRADGTLLARQRARWYGKDVFLERHGGEEYQEKQNKQRIDFGEAEELYSIYLNEGDAAAWIDGRWQQVVPGDETHEYSLLVLNSVEERLLKFDLWDVGGKGKVSLNLIKSMEPSSPTDFEREFKFVGARTRSQLLFEVKGERVLVSPKDWFLFTEGRWIKLTTPEQIDAYVERRLTGPLFVIDEILRDDGRQVLQGLIYNATRTDVKLVEVALQQGAFPVVKDSPAPIERVAFPAGRESVDEDLIEDESQEGEFESSEGYEEYMERLRERYQGDVPEEHLERLKRIRGTIQRGRGGRGR